jgi:GH24 family phage-related lysozyme (muramidase)
MNAYALSAAGLALIKSQEGFRAVPTQLPDGSWLVGYGHARARAGTRVTKKAAAELLKRDLEPFERLVNKAVKQPFTQSQFDALVSFAFSLGAAGFGQSQVLERLNAGDVLAAASAMDDWRGDSSEFADALMRRRAAEKAMLLKDVACEPAPSVLLRAKREGAVSKRGARARGAAAKDRAASSLAPAERIVAILKSEPQTEALLLTQVVADDISDDGELVTAHAKPVARKIESVLPTLPLRHNRAKNAGVLASMRRIRLSKLPPALAHAGLVALLLTGAVLVGVGVSVLFEGRDELAALAGGAALTGPGLAAVMGAGAGLMRAPYGKLAD